MYISAILLTSTAACAANAATIRRQAKQCTFEARLYQWPNDRAQLPVVEVNTGIRESYRYKSCDAQTPDQPSVTCNASKLFDGVDLSITGFSAAYHEHSNMFTFALQGQKYESGAVRDVSAICDKKDRYQVTVTHDPKGYADVTQAHYTLPC